MHLVDVMRRCSQCVDASNVGYIMSKMLSKMFVDVNKMPSNFVFVMLTECRLKLFSCDVDKMLSILEYLMLKAMII